VAEQPESVAGIAELYLGNILYALERCALAMAEEGKSSDAQFYRGIGRLLAEAHGRARKGDAGGASGAA
jgi:hypothetical protein